MNRTALAALALACVASPALADVAPVVIQASPPPGATIPYGDVLVALAQIALPAAAPAVTALIGIGVKKVFPVIGPLIASRTDQVVEDALQKWAAYAINEVAGAEKGKSLSFDTGSAVLNALVNRASDRAAVSKKGKQLVEWAGGYEEIARKGFRLLHLDEGVSGEMLEQVIADLKAQGRIA